mmetsp:Transcript_125333/g.350989  ORF Transcript_125333/g.350989 Transcript_125333/m.350989 type:complete len:230 (-) Transcript_125333:852-1541(-)
MVAKLFAAHEQGVGPVPGGLVQVAHVQVLRHAPVDGQAALLVVLVGLREVGAGDALLAVLDHGLARAVDEPGARHERPGRGGARGDRAPRADSPTACCDGLVGRPCDRALDGAPGHSHLELAAPDGEEVVALLHLVAVDRQVPRLGPHQRHRAGLPAAVVAGIRSARDALRIRLVDGAGAVHRPHGVARRRCRRGGRRRRRSRRRRRCWRRSGLLVRTKLPAACGLRLV